MDREITSKGGKQCREKQKFQSMPSGHTPEFLFFSWALPAPVGGAPPNPIDFSLMRLPCIAA